MAPLFPQPRHDLKEKDITKLARGQVGRGKLYVTQDKPNLKDIRFINQVMIVSGKDNLWLGKDCPC